MANELFVVVVSMQIVTVCETNVLYKNSIIHFLSYNECVMTDNI